MVYPPDVCIQQPCQIWGEEHLHLGHQVHIGRGSEIMADGGVTIGNNVVISFNCVLWSIDHRYEGDTLPYDKARIRRPITIHDNVWMGRNVIVRGGVTIGEGAVVAIGSVVAKDVPPLAIVGGNPARILRFRDAKRYASHKDLGLYLWREADVCGACKAPDFYLAESATAGLSSSPMKRLMVYLDTQWRYFRWRLMRR